MKLLQNKLHCLVSDMCTGPVPHNQTCLMVNMSADPVGIIAGLVQVEQTCTLARVAARRMLAGPLPLIIMPIICNSIMHAFSICHICLYGVSLSAVPAGVMPR